MRNLIVLSVLLLATAGAAAQQPRLDSLYRAIDEAIAQKNRYKEKKERALDSLKHQLGRAATPDGQHREAMALWQEYASFQNDSALRYASLALELAQKAGRADWQTDACIALGSQHAKAGYYSEAEHYFAEAGRQPMSRRQEVQFYTAYSQLYGDMASYSKDKRLRGQYFQRVDSLRGKLFQLADPHSPDYLRRMVVKLTNEKRYEEAKAYCDEWAQRVSPQTGGYAAMAFYQSLLHRRMGHEEQEKWWLGMSALSDIQSATMDQASLWSLAERLSEEGDIERAHRYIEFSWECNSFFGTRTRSWLVSPVLSMINNTYKGSLQKANRRLTWAIVLVSLLAAGLLLSIGYLARKRRQLATARNELRLYNGQLSALNTRLVAVNGQLSEANQVKDEYIGKFLSLCSDYIDKLDNYRIWVNRKMKANQQDSLLRMTASEQMKEDELKELFGHFDAVFLHLFPDFVERFNELLRPECRIVPTDEGRLNTELRIFALIRLGIDESSKIAEFLRYSPNSIYAYRARTKNKAAGNRDDFEREVKRIGMKAAAEGQQPAP